MITVRKFEQKDLPKMARIWNQVVEEGVAFPQKENLTVNDAKDFFEAQTVSAVAVNGLGEVKGLFILHPNNVGRVGHICNASFAVDENCHGEHIGETLVKACLEEAIKSGFRIMQFNAVVASNVHALHLYERLGFTDLGIIPGGFENRSGDYEDIHIMYCVL